MPPYVSSTPVSLQPTTPTLVSLHSSFALNVVGLPREVFASLRMFALYGLSKTVLALTLVIGLIIPLVQLVTLLPSIPNSYNSISDPQALMSAEFVGSELHHYRLGPVGTLFVSGRVNCFHAVISTVGATQFGTHLMVYRSLVFLILERYRH